MDDALEATEDALEAPLPVLAGDVAVEEPEPEAETTQIFYQDRVQTCRMRNTNRQRTPVAGAGALQPGRLQCS